METFIRVWENFISKDYCNHVIERFERHANNPELSHLVQDNKWGSSLKRKDQAIFLQHEQYNEPELTDLISNAVDSCAAQYGEEFAHIKDMYLTNRKCIKLQKTLPYGGYHVWHHEQLADPDGRNRELVWILYLNDMPQGEAETEFMYQHMKVQPTVGTVCIFPAAFTHLHRGLTVYTRPKYIATGWYFTN